MLWIVLEIFFVALLLVHISFQLTEIETRLEIITMVLQRIRGEDDE